MGYHKDKIFIDKTIKCQNNTIAEIMEIKRKKHKIIIEENPPVIHIWCSGKKKLTTGTPDRKSVV